MKIFNIPLLHSSKGFHCVAITVSIDLIKSTQQVVCTANIIPLSSNLPQSTTEETNLPTKLPHIQIQNLKKSQKLKKHFLLHILNKLEKLTVNQGF